jgi:hypothetical protein
LRLRVTRWKLRERTPAAAFSLPIDQKRQTIVPMRFLDANRRPHARIKPENMLRSKTL